MSYRISSEAFDDPDMPELLKKLVKFFKGQDVDFYIVGATARDIVLGMICNRGSRRKTNDLDIAIMIHDWEAFEKINALLSDLPGITKSPKQKQRFYYENHLTLDVIPFGEIARADRNIYWPPDETPVMSVSGFVEMAAKALSVIIDDELTIKVASLPGIFILKLMAWQDRYRATNKDADDMAYLLDEYFEINLERIAKTHPDIIESDDFTSFTAGASLMGRDVRTLLVGNEELILELTSIVDKEIGKAEDSLLINQMLETHRSKKYEEIFKAMALFLKEIKK